jgi:hypothetical protein
MDFTDMDLMFFEDLKNSQQNIFKLVFLFFEDLCLVFTILSLN